MLSITLLGTGSPLPDPDRAGPATLISTSADEHFLVDAGRGCLMRLAAAGVGVDRITAVLLTHLHSDHITDLNDVITTRWVITFEPSPLTIVGPPGTQDVVDGIVASIGNDIQYRLDHHADLRGYGFTPVDVIEVADGRVEIGSTATITTAPTDHRPVHPTIGFRIDHDGASVVAAGDTVPCEGLDRLSEGADALVHTVIRKDVLENVSVQRLQDTLDYHSSPAEAAQTAARAGVGTLVLTHYVPAFPPGDAAADEWRALAAQHFHGTIEVGDDLHHIQLTNS